MLNRDFKEWIMTFKDSISNYEYYVDFNKVIRNTDSIKVELNILNTLIGSNNIEQDFKNLVKKYPEVLQCIPIMLAVRDYNINILNEKGEHNFNFKEPNYTIDEYCVFMNETGLFNLLSNKKISNLNDYIMGVETGLDSNGRKNRGGHLMEDLVESYIIKAGFEKNRTYYKEIKIKELEKNLGINISDYLYGERATKRFDFAIISKNIVYLIETNFYKSSGSKLNETARSYKNISLDIENINGVEFMWITDGKGWLKAQNNLSETFHVMKHIYNINDLEKGLFETL